MNLHELFVSNLSIHNIETQIKNFISFKIGMNLSLLRFVANELRRVDFHTHKISFLQTKTTPPFFMFPIIYVCFDSKGRSDENFVKLYHGKVIQKGDCRVFLPPAENQKTFIVRFISKNFNRYAQEIGQFRSFLFHFSWSQILISTSQRNGPLASDF